MEPSLSAIKRLFAFSSNRCAFPDCLSPIIEDSGTVTGLVCHIAARSKGGPRYNPKQTEEERHAFQNLILMCGQHSKLIDSEPKRYTIDLLQGFKAIQERQGVIELSQADARKAELLLRDYRAIYITAGGHVMFHSPGSVQAESVVIKNQKKTIKIILWYPFFARVFRLPSEKDVRAAAAELLGHSNRSAPPIPALGLGGRETEINKLLRIKT